MEETTRNILQRKFIPPTYLTRVAQHFLKKLLGKRAESRLGSKPKGAEAVKKHAYFRGLEWDKVASRSLTPPYKPSLVNIFTFLTLYPKIQTAKSRKDAIIFFMNFDNQLQIYCGF